MNRTTYLRFNGVAIRLGLFLGVALLSCLTSARGQTAPKFSGLVIFGDDLSDVDNFRNTAKDKAGISYPGNDYNYDRGRFTDSPDTDPSAVGYIGVWHEQLAWEYLGRPPATASTDGGFDYAYGGATTEDGTKEVAINGFFGVQYTITIRNIGQQVSDHLTRNGNPPPDPAALHIVCGGENDLFDDSSAANVTAAAARITALVERLARFSVPNILVANVPPLGAPPRYSRQPQQAMMLNQASADFRDQLNADLDALQSRLVADGVTLHLYRLDLYQLYLGIFQNPGVAGFINVTVSAQDKSNVRADDYLFWDDIHPTTAGHHQIAAGAFAAVASGSVLPNSLGNIATRLPVGTGDNALIGGFIVTGASAKKVIVRGLGPSLTGSGPSLRQSGVNNPLQNPSLDLRDGNGTQVAFNDDWKNSQQAEIQADGLAPSDDRESALIQTLPAGSYTVTLRGVGNTTGIAVLEAYNLR